MVMRDEILTRDRLYMHTKTNWAMMSSRAWTFGRRHLDISSPLRATATTRRTEVIDRRPDGHPPSTRDFAPHAASWVAYVAQVTTCWLSHGMMAQWACSTITFALLTAQLLIKARSQTARVSARTNRCSLELGFYTLLPMDLAGLCIIISSWLG